MDRRRFLLTSLALTAPLAAEAQQAGKVYRIGFLSYLGCGNSLDPAGSFRNVLRDLGYVEGRNVVVECRDAPGRVDRFPDAVRELIALNLDVLVTEGTPASLAAKRLTTMPIVMVGVADPERSGLIASLARPGGNVTGPALFSTRELAAKVLQLTREVIPHLSRIAVLRDSTNPTHDPSLIEVGREVGVTVQLISVRGSDDLQDAFAAVDRRSQALLVYPIPLDRAHIPQIIEFARLKRLPVTTFWEGYAEQGGLLFYGTRLTDEYRRAGVYLAKILKGAKPADIPVERATKFELLINLKNAKALGLTIPPSVLARADQVIDP